MLWSVVMMSSGLIADINLPRARSVRRGCAAHTSAHSARPAAHMHPQALLGYLATARQPLRATAAAPPTARAGNTAILLAGNLGGMVRGGRACDAPTCVCVLPGEPHLRGQQRLQDGCKLIIGRSDVMV